MAHCEHCLCGPAPCLATVDPVRFGWFCAWMASGDETKRRHVVDRSRIELESEQPTPGQAVTSAPPEAMKEAGLIVRMKRCPAWKKATDCGCGVNRCARGRGKDGLVNHQDCFTCPHLPPAT